MLKANNDGKEITFRFNSLQVLSKTPTLLSLEELVEIEKQSSEDELSEQELELTPIATSFHSGCLIHAPYNQLIIVGGCFDEDDEWYEEESCTNEVMSFNYMENKWKLLFSRVLNDDESTSTTVEESDTNNVQEQISHINISSDEQYLERIVQSPIIQQSSSTAERRSNTPPRIWGHSCSYSPLTRSLYVFGGINYHDEYNEHLFSFSLDRREWKKIDAQKDSSMEELPCGRQGHRTVYIPSIHKMVLFGGFSSSHLDDFCEFDVRNNTWSRVEEDPAFLMNRPSCREVFSMIYAENRNSIIIFGGKTEDERYSDLREFSLTTRRWTLLYQGKIKKTNHNGNTKKVTKLFKDIPSERSSHTAVYLENYQKMIILSGYDGEEWFCDCYEFDFNTMQWDGIKLETKDLPDTDREIFTKGFSSHVAEFNNITNEMLVFGGWDGEIDSNILFSIKIPSYHSVAMKFKLLSMNDLFSDVSIHCNEH
ncbi:predicted protein [Naegleria gruberi]|uniref:Predicted protein n=1 Tax=Naegleria gruberi TaxID=5762 RepID=D2VNK9_NAEGR|nr:uncharacterized protein NAEGRDRAFT_70537 [Naegleria gruberi]EFC41676.1 predicted protein [Naegleria gruberi]|eukprot:XP_002674420.1 predicted protein [Naegleria gruberi strain NEG-M]